MRHRPNKQGPSKTIPLLLLSGLLLLTAVATGCSKPGRVLFTRSAQDLDEVWVMNGDGSEPTRLASDSDWTYGVSGPSWSPDGRRIVFTVSTRDADEIWIMNADGTSVERLTEGDDVDPTWSPDGKLIAFARTAPRPGIWVMNPDGTGARKISRAGEDPAWSPDGKRIAVAGIEVMNADGSDRRKLVSGRQPAWSPDGTKIAYVGRSDNDQGIFVIGADRSEPQHLTSPMRGKDGKLAIAVEIEDTHPTWSPDGKRICFTRSTPDGSDIWVMNADGTDQKKLGSRGADPSWGK